MKSTSTAPARCSVPGPPPMEIAPTRGLLTDPGVGGRMVQPAAPAGRPNLGGASARHGSMQIGGGGVRLDPDDVEAIAQRVAELLGARACTRAVRYVDAAELARVLGVERDWATPTPARSAPSASVVPTAGCASTCSTSSEPSPRTTRHQLQGDLHAARALGGGAPGRDWSSSRMRANVARDHRTQGGRGAGGAPGRDSGRQGARCMRSVSPPLSGWADGPARQRHRPDHQAH